MSIEYLLYFWWEKIMQKSRDKLPNGFRIQYSLNSYQGLFFPPPPHPHHWSILIISSQKSRQSLGQAWLQIRESIFYCNNLPKNAIQAHLKCVSPEESKKQRPLRGASLFSLIQPQLPLTFLSQSELSSENASEQMQSDRRPQHKGCLIQDVYPTPLPLPPTPTAYEELSSRWGLSASREGNVWEEAQQ